MQQIRVESERLAALYGYHILDTPADPAFDDFVQIAAHVCEAPIAVVNLVDESRQWFAAEIGLGVRETPLDISICARAILQPGLFVVPDLTKDSRFDSNPLVVGNALVRFYGGALLETPQGIPIGTVCVLDYEPRPGGLTDQQGATLKALARQVMARLELRRSMAEKELLIQEAHHRVKNSLQMVQALLSLQARATTDTVAARQLRESAARVQTFGMMHEHLYRAGAAVHVDLAEYLRNLASDQEISLASTLVRRGILFDGISVLWPSAEAPTWGLVLLELVTNALKYGEGTITVALRRTGNAAVLTVTDEGQGLTPGFDLAEGAGLGMRIVNSLLNGAGGKLEVDRSSPTTSFVARIPLPAAAPLRLHA